MESSAIQPNTIHPVGSVSAWLANADDDSQRRKNHDHEATGHSSKSKPTELTAVDMMGSPIDPGFGSKSLSPGATPLRHISGLGGISNVGEAKWIEIEITVDSGACETVMPMSWCRGISVLSSRQYMDGVEYEVANGETIPNLGERRCLMSTAGSQLIKKISFQVADVHKPLLSISRIADLGFDCVLGKFGGYLADSITGERIPLQRVDNLYVLKAWVRQDPNDTTPFAGPV